jgi:hypothetical protein
MVNKFPFNGCGGGFIYFVFTVTTSASITPTASHVPSTTTIPGGSTTIEASSFPELCDHHVLLP